jgi:hypothetical protein
MTFISVVTVIINSVMMYVLEKIAYFEKRHTLSEEKKAQF